MNIKAALHNLKGSKTDQSGASVTKGCCHKVLFQQKLMLLSDCIGIIKQLKNKNKL